MLVTLRMRGGEKARCNQELSSGETVNSVAVMAEWRWRMADAEMRACRSVNDGDGWIDVRRGLFFVCRLSYGSGLATFFLHARLLNVPALLGRTRQRYF